VSIRTIGGLMTAANYHTAFDMNDDPEYLIAQDAPLADLAKLDGVHVLNVQSDGVTIVPEGARAPGCRKMVAVLIEVGE
jgi:hypothetical protein